MTAEEKEYKRRYCLANREKVKEAQRRYRLAHLEKVKEIYVV